MPEDRNNLKKIARGMPDLPGIYLFKDKTDKIIYIGKANSLRKRTLQYFDENRLEPAKREMVSQAFNIDSIVTKNESEALALEASLIQQHRPPYNIRLVDDSSYLYIKITSESYPKITLTRKVIPDNAWYRGPYPNAYAVRQTLKEVRKFFPWCNLVSSLRGRPQASRSNPPKSSTNEIAAPRPSQTMVDGSQRRDGRACFAYHIGLCPGICIGAISLEEYQKNFSRLKKFLDGETQEVVASLKERMTLLSKQQNFEKAGILRDKIKSIEKTMLPQDLVTPYDEDADVFGLATSGGHGSVALLQVRHGRIIGHQIFSFLLPDKKEEKEIWEEYLAQYLPTAQGGSNNIYLPAVGAIHELPLRVRVSFPQRGWKKQLIDMARTNAQESLRKSETELQSPQNLLASINDLKEKLNLPNLPKRIETYDISNIQGTLATASMVVFIDGKPAPSEYRKFKILTTGEPNDVGMMKEVLARRFKNDSQESKAVSFLRKQESVESKETQSTKTDSRFRGNDIVLKKQKSWSIPDLIVLDGGRGQLNGGISVLKKLGINIPIVSLAKREEEVFTTYQKNSIILPRTSAGFYLLQRMRDEAHRFTISYHRLLRKKYMTKSILEEIPGVGSVTRKKLLRTFGSLGAIREASLKELEKVLGSKKKAELLAVFLRRGDS